MVIEKVLYRAQVKATAGRDTGAVSSDGVLDLIVTMPRELGGTNGVAPIQSSCLRPVMPSAFWG